MQDLTQKCKCWMFGALWVWAVLQTPVLSELGMEQKEQTQSRCGANTEQFLPPRDPQALPNLPGHCWHWESTRQTLVQILEWERSQDNPSGCWG